MLDFAELTTPALRATPPLRGGEFVNAIFKRNTSKGETCASFEATSQAARVT